MPSLATKIVQANPHSARMMFQWKYVLRAKGEVLNVGSGEDPCGFGEYAVHLDILPLHSHHKKFIQASAYDMPLADCSFSTVILGDIIEHLDEPERAVKEACRVSSDLVVMTIFEEWRLPGYGHWPADERFSGHCWQFTDEMIDKLIPYPAWRPIEYFKEPELLHEGHVAYDWCIALRRSTPCASS
jgi:SAM-dependent methyltransferase